MNENKLVEDVAAMKQQLTEVYTALVGNNIGNDGGIVKRLSSMESRLESMEKKQTIIGVQFKILWAGAGAIVMFLGTLFTKK